MIRNKLVTNGLTNLNIHELANSSIRKFKEYLSQMTSDHHLIIQMMIKIRIKYYDLIFRLKQKICSKLLIDIIIDVCSRLIIEIPTFVVRIRVTANLTSMSTITKSHIQISCYNKKKLIKYESISLHNVKTKCAL